MSEQQKKDQPHKIKNPFLLRLSQQDRPQRAFSLNRLNHPEDLHRDGTYIAKKDLVEHQLFDHHLVQGNIRIQGHLKRLHATFIHEKVGQFYAYHFMNRLIHASQEKLQDNILKQTEQLKGKRAHFQLISNSIKARQGNLKQLHKCLDNLFNNQDDNITKHVFREQIIHYRKLTHFVINHIRTWRQYLNQISPQIEYASFMHKQEDYFIKILNDCEFIFNSFLSKYLKFSYKNDPFIMRPHVDGRGQEKYLELFHLDQEERAKYMIDLNYLSEERSKYLASKIHSRSDKIKDIQKIYHYKENPLSSRIFIRKFQNKEDTDKKQQTFVDNFMSQDKKARVSEFQKKSQKIKKIKEIFGRTSDSQVKKIINSKKFEALSDYKQPSPYKKKLVQTQFQQKKNKFEQLNYETDFENMLRKKQVSYISENITPSKTQRSFKTVKINDSISQSRKFISKDQGVDELEKVLTQLDSFSPQKLQNFKLKKKQDVTASPIIKLNEGKSPKSRVVQPIKTMLQHNEEVYVSVRNQVIEEIQKDKLQRNKLQERKRQENEKIHKILQKKLNEESLKILKGERQKNLIGKKDLAQQFNSLEIFGYQSQQNKIQNSKKLTKLEEQLKKQMQLKWLREVQDELKRKTDLSAMQREKQEKQQYLKKQSQRVERKRKQQERFEIIERQERAKIMKKKMQLDEQRKREIQNQMRVIIEREKEKMEQFAAIQRMQLEEEMKEQMKKKILESIKRENEKFYDDNKHQVERKKLQSQYRDQVREKIEEQYKVGQAMKKNRQAQQRMARLRLVKQKLGQYDSKANRNTESRKKLQEKQKNLQKQISREEAEKEELKSRITQFPDFRESLFPKYNKNNKGGEQDKKKLRQQFQLQLFAFNRPEKQDQNQDNKSKFSYEEGLIFPVKKYEQTVNKNVQLYEQQEKKKEQQQNEQGINKGNKEQFEIQIPALNRFGNTMKSKVSESPSEKFTRFSQQQAQKEKIEDEDEQMRLKLGMSKEEYTIYQKKKHAITKNRDFQEEITKKKVEKEKKEIKRVIDDFEKMSQLNSDKEKKNVLNEIQIEDLQEDQQIFDKFSQGGQAKSINNQQRQSELKEKQTKKAMKKEKQEQNQVEKIEIKHNFSKKKEKQKNKEIDRITVNSRVQSVTEKHFMTSSEQDDFEDDRIKKKKLSPKKVRKQEKQKQRPLRKKIQQIKEQNNQIIEEKEKQLKTFIKKREIPLSSVGSFFDDHFDHLPKLVKKLNIYKREDLKKFILEHSSFTILQYIKESVSIGQAVILLNENKKKYRSLDIIHLGTYDENDYFQFLISISKYCFRHDPCEEIVLSSIYEKQIQQQWDFIKKLQAKFDPYGAIFQKKIFNTQFERKYVMRRNIGEQCQVKNLQKHNRGCLQFKIDFFITENNNQIVNADFYEPSGPKTSYYALIAHYISQHCSEEQLSSLIIKSTDKQATFQQKSLANLAKLSLSMRKHESFQRLSELQSHQFSDIISLNLQLINNNQTVIPFPPEMIQNPIHTTWINFNNDLQLSYDFYSLMTKININEQQSHEPEEFMAKYFRYTPNKKNKSFVLKSSAYSTRINVLPCKSSKYKIFVMDSEEYDGLRKKSPSEKGDQKIDLGIYLRVFFANVENHEKMSYETIWLPEIVLKNEKNLLSGLQKLTQKNESGISRGCLDYTFIDYLGNSLVVEPTHRDLLITPPFIMGVMNMQIETVMEGSPVFVQRIDKKDMKYLREVEKMKKQSD